MSHRTLALLFKSLEHGRENLAQILVDKIKRIKRIFHFKSCVVQVLFDQLKLLSLRSTVNQSNPAVTGRWRIYRHKSNFRSQLQQHTLLSLPVGCSSTHYACPLLDSALPVHQLLHQRWQVPPCEHLAASRFLGTDCSVPVWP